MSKHIIAIKWLDADNDAGWLPDNPEDDMTNAKEMISAGVHVSGLTKDFQIDHRSKFVTISFCWNPDANEWLAKHRIPIKWITDIEVLKEIGGEDG